MADRDPTPEQDIATARAALAQGDLKHAIHHLGCAMATNPMQPEWIQMMNQIIAQSHDPMSLVQLDGEASFVEAANRSYLLAYHRKWEEAVDLITDVAEIRPDIPYMLWCEWWLSQPGVLQSISLDSLIRGIVVDILKITSACPVPTTKDDPRWPTLESSARILTGMRQLHPGEGMLWFGSSMVARRLGTPDESKAFAEEAYRIDPSWKSAIGVANALRDAGKIDEAATWFRKSLEHDRDDVSAHLDMGDMFLEADRLDEALREYERALAKDDDSAWARASATYVRWKYNQDPVQRLALLRLTEADGDTSRAQDLYDRIEPPKLFMNRLPRPADASSHALQDIFQQMFHNPAEHHGSTVRLRLSHVESPSVVASFWLQLEMWGPQVAFDYQVEKVQQPDPRQPKANVPHTIWFWDGTQPKPGVRRPDGRVVQAVHELASEPFSLDIWTPIAQRTAQELGPAALDSLLATLVYPPRPPSSDWRVLNWVQRSQIATALIIAHMGEGWANSPRQQYLYSMLYGPTDWTTGAAIVALGVLARRDPAIRAEVSQAFGWMIGQIPQEGFCCWELPIVMVWQTFPDLDDVTRKRLEAHEERIFSNQVGSTTVHMCQLEAKKFDMNEEVARAQAAQQRMAGGGGGDPDPLVFPGQRVAKLSDYVGLMKAMQTGNMMGALNQYGLDMTGYSQVATAWGQKMAADPDLNAKFSAMMQR